VVHRVRLRDATADPFQLYSPAQQARFMGWSTYLAWKTPGVRSHAQFLLRDIDAAESGRQPGTRGYWRDFQMGIFTHDGQAKPAMQAFETLPQRGSVDRAR
jgi:hypothetical protein